MSDKCKSVFAEFKREYERWTRQIEGYFEGEGSERLRMYRVLSGVEQMSSKLWRMTHITSQESLNDPGED